MGICQMAQINRIMEHNTGIMEILTLTHAADRQGDLFCLFTACHVHPHEAV